MAVLHSRMPSRLSCAEKLHSSSPRDADEVREQEQGRTRTSTWSR